MFFPVCIDIKDKKCLIIGGGKLAYRKILTLLRYGAKIEVIAKKISEEKIKELENVNIFIQEFNKVTVKEYALVIAATDNDELNNKIVDICNKDMVLVNNITSKNNMSLRFGAIYEDEDYQILVSTHGKNCRESKKVRDFIKEKLDKKSY